ncbi:MAG: HEAT repeat domain-containing protein [Planctomycetota bacterium]
MTIRPTTRTILTAALLLLTAACGGSGDPEPRTAPPAAEPEPARRALRDVLDAKLGELGLKARTDVDLARELRTNVGLLPGETAAAGDEEATESEPTGAALDPELIEMLDGLASMVRADPRQLDLARQDIASLGEEMAAVVVSRLRDETADDADLRVLMDLAAGSGESEVALALAELAAAHDEEWARHYAAWTITFVADAPGADAVVPGLLRRLKYERDREAFVWIAAALAAFQNYAGLPALFDLAGGPVGDAAADAARAQIASIVAAAEVPDAAALSLAWSRGEVGRSGDVSDALVARTWLLVADLSGEHFQLRGVDDARYQLSRLGPWAGSVLAEALEDDDEYVRLHVCQSLERMGRRGHQAAEGLALALLDPSDGVAGAAAEALVAVAGDGALAPLQERLASSPPHEVRVALVRALGRAETPPIETLETTFADAEGIADLRLAAAEGLLRTGNESAVLPWLAEAMTARFGDPAGAEAVVEAWLARSTQDEAERRGDLLERWNGLAPAASIIHTAEQASERRTARAALIAEFLGS